MRNVLIHAKPIFDFGNAARLYYYCRAVDSQRQGWQRIGTKGLQQFFSISERGLKRWAQQAQSFGLIQNFEIGSINGDKYIYIKYSSIKKVSELTEGNFAKAIVPIHVLKDLNGLKRFAIELAVAAQQERVSRAIQHKNKNKKVFVPQLPAKPKGKNGKRRSKTADGCEFINHETNTIFVRQSYEPVSCAQETLAINLDISLSSVKKYLSNLESVTLFTRVYSSDERAGNIYSFTPYKTKEQKAKEMQVLKSQLKRKIKKDLQRRFLRNYICSALIIIL